MENGEMKRTWVAATLLGIVFRLGTVGALDAAQRESPAGSLSAKEIAGKKLFMQRCSLCHLPPLNAPEGRSFGPPLKNLVSSPDRETRVAETIRKGSTRMPGFQYGLKPDEIENIVAYMKTMR
jgi:mono/diheme cytochrome c family protein